MLSPAFVAARDGDLAALQHLVAGGWDAAERDRHGSSALMWAAGSGHLHGCKYLGERFGVPASLDAVAAGGVSKKQLKRLRSPLHWAARHGHLDVCKCVTCPTHASARKWRRHKPALCTK